MVIYADNSATTKVRPEVVEAMLPFLTENWGNASSIHSLGRTARDAVDRAREQVAHLVNCRAEEIFFTPCGTASNNVAILGRARFLQANRRGRHLITTQIEHPSAFGPAQFLESQGWSVTYLPVDREGFVSPESLANAITRNTTIISIIWANNEIGTVQPISELAAIAEERGIPFHTDAVQIPGKLPIDVTAVPISSLSASGHKFYAPKGIGFMYLRNQHNVMPIEFGGGQERGLFPGTESVANIVAIGKAAELARLELDDTSSRLHHMQRKLIDHLRSIKNVKITGAQEVDGRLPGHVSCVLPGAEGEALVLRCDLQGVCISSGSACHQGVFEPSHVLRALKLSDEEALGAIRVSFGRFNSEAECDKVMSVLEKALSSGAVKAAHSQSKC
jgi:cysteine desulfurase